MKILVIGNGFDLEHGLPTKYKDFLDFMQGIYLINSITSISDKGTFIDQLERATKHKVDENIKKYFTQEKFLNPDFMKEWKEERISKELIDGANNNIWIKYFIENMNYEKEGWIDLESEISNVILCFDYMKTISIIYDKSDILPNNMDYEKEEVVNKIIKYIGLNKITAIDMRGKNLKHCINILNLHLNNLIRCLEIYLENCVGNINIGYVAVDIKDIKFDKILSFNYTNTYEKVYDIFSYMKYHYIHGKADIDRTADNNNIVLGIDEYLDDEAKNKELEFIAFKKYFQRIYKKTENTYKKWIEEIEEDYKMIINKEEKYRNILYKQKDETYINKYKGIINNLHSNKNEIYIFGHSLDITDKDIIRELIECPNTETTIFYYDKGVYAQQIANMVKIIGQDELIKRVSGADPTIIFKQQQNKIQRN